MQPTGVPTLKKKEFVYVLFVWVWVGGYVCLCKRHQLGAIKAQAVIHQALLSQFSLLVEFFTFKLQVKTNIVKF